MSMLNRNRLDPLSGSSPSGLGKAPLPPLQPRAPLGGDPQSDMVPQRNLAGPAPYIPSYAADISPGPLPGRPMDTTALDETPDPSDPQPPPPPPHYTPRNHQDPASPRTKLSQGYSSQGSGVYRGTQSHAAPGPAPRETSHETWSANHSSTNHSSPSPRPPPGAAAQAAQAEEAWRGLEQTAAQHGLRSSEGSGAGGGGGGNGGPGSVPLPPLVPRSAGLPRLPPGALPPPAPSGPLPPPMNRAGSAAHGPRGSAAQDDPLLHTVRPPMPPPPQPQLGPSRSRNNSGRHLSPAAAAGAGPGAPTRPPSASLLPPPERTASPSPPPVPSKGPSLKALPIPERASPGPAVPPSLTARAAPPNERTPTKQHSRITKSFDTQGGLLMNDADPTASPAFRTPQGRGTGGMTDAGGPQAGPIPSDPDLEVRTPALGRESIIKKNFSMRNEAASLVMSMDGMMDVPPPTVRLRCVTWNMGDGQGGVGDAEELVGDRAHYDIFAFGCQEGQALARWRASLLDTLGPTFDLLASDTLGQISIMVFVSKLIANRIIDVHTAAVACGVANILGNKGGVGVSIALMGGLRIVLINSHLAAHAERVKDRNDDFQRIRHSLFRSGPSKNGGGGGGKGGRDPSPSPAPLPSKIPGGTQLMGVREEEEETRARGGRGKAGGKGPEREKEDREKEKEKENLGGAARDALSDPEPSGRTSAGPPPGQQVQARRSFARQLSKPGGSAVAEQVDELPELELESHALRRCLPHFAQWDVTKQHHVTVWMGDLNYRVEGIRRAVDRLIELRMFEVMRSNDQLARELGHGRAFKNFEEAPITFPPTFKFDKGTDTYDTSAKQRVPSWTDRILWKVHKSFRPYHRKNPIVKCEQYGSLMKVQASDHKPVFAVLEVSAAALQATGRKGHR